MCDMCVWEGGRREKKEKPRVKEVITPPLLCTVGRDAHSGGPLYYHIRVHTHSIMACPQVDLYQL